METTALVASLTTLPPDDEAAFRRRTAEVECLEVRADLIGEVDVARLRERFDGRLLYTLRSRVEGGKGENDAAVRRARFAEAVAHYDLVDLEANRDLDEETLDLVEPEKRLISWHGAARSAAGLKRLFDDLARTPARYYKLIPHAQQTGDGVATLAFLKGLGRRDVIAFCTGTAGSWTRILAPRLGSPLVYGSLGRRPAAPGQMSIARLRRDYGLPALPPAEFLCGIIGNPVAHSLSPQLHNGAYRALGIPGLYLPFHVETFADFWLDVVESEVLQQLGLPLRGFSVTAPFKGIALAIAGASSPRAEYINAANTLIYSEGVWEAETTDPEGTIAPLRRRDIALRDKDAAVVGCGGAGKAAAYGLHLGGARVTLVNRGLERGEKAAQELDMPFVPLAEFDPGAFDLLIQATSLGRRDSDPLPFAVDRLRPGAVVLDLVYGPEPTPLLRAARDAGHLAIDGREVLLEQALSQFRLMTGTVLEAALARHILGMGDAPASGGATATATTEGSR